MRKGYFFTLDALIAVIILVIGIMVIFSYYIFAPDTERTGQLTKDISGVLSTTRVLDVCWQADSANQDCDCSYSALEDPGVCKRMTDRKMTMMQLFGVLHHYSQRQDIEDIIKEMIVEAQILPVTHNMSVELRDPGNPGDYEQLYPLVAP